MPPIKKIQLTNLNEENNNLSKYQEHEASGSDSGEDVHGDHLDCDAIMYL